MSSISSEYSLKREYDEWNDRLEQMTWKATHSTRENQKYPNWNPESEKEWAEKIRRITEEQPSEGSDAVACHRNKRSDKTKEQIETEKLLNLQNSVSYMIYMSRDRGVPHRDEEERRNIRHS